MKFCRILSSQLPAIDPLVMECINLGKWILFKPGQASADAGCDFFLKTGDSIFCLNDKGGIIGKVDLVDQDMDVDQVFYFSDLPQPASLSNFYVKVA